MPRFSLDTNVPVSKISNEFLKDTLNVLKETLGKGTRYCLTSVNPSLKMTLGGSNEPCGIIQVTCIGSLGPEENKKHVAVLTDHVNKTIGIPKDKLFVFFHPSSPDSCGYLGTTFHQLAIVEKRARLLP